MLEGLALIGAYTVELGLRWILDDPSGYDPGSPLGGGHLTSHKSLLNWPAWECGSGGAVTLHRQYIVVTANS